jgi:signal transduction histidine kinase
MKNKYKLLFIFLLCLSCLISCSVIGIILSQAYAQSQYKILSELAQGITEENPKSEQYIIKMIKDSLSPVKNTEESNKDILALYGFKPMDFAFEYIENMKFSLLIIFPVSAFLIYMIFRTYKRIYRKRISDLTTYLEKINLEYDATILPDTEDDFSPLQDEIYKTVIKLRQTSESALLAHKNLAGHLTDISHQIKTPVAAISIMAQLLDNEKNHTYVEKLQRQTIHLEQLMNALLTLSRIDAGVLKLEKNKVDVYSMLQLSLETLEELIRKKNIQVVLPNHPEITFQGDMEWSIEAFINLIKNCIEHTPEGSLISVDYTQNPLYTEIKLEDNGEGFNEKDLPHIFERFYFGENATKTGTGIGLSLAKSLIEMQGGLISAKNLLCGGACFIIRYYSH